MARRSKHGYSDREIILAWNTSSTREEAQAKLPGIGMHAMTQRVCRLRQGGVPMRNMNEGQRKLLDIGDLRKYAEACLDGKVKWDKEDDEEDD